MSDERIDLLAESARNRGLKLVRSRVRTPGKKRFGKVGLTDARGRPVFGIDDKGPAAKPEDVEQYLRNLGARDWGASLDVAVLPRKRRAKTPRREAANDAEPAPRPKPAAKRPPPPPKPRPKPQLRDARPSDTGALTELIRCLGHEIDEKGVRKNLATLRKAGEPPIVATIGKAVVGLCSTHRTPTIHRDAPLGRITILIVAGDVQGQGIGRMLVEEAHRRLAKAGCKMVELTSNDRRGEAHAFYRHLGYERTSVRFFITL